MLNPKNIFKIPQENLVKTAIQNYIKKSTVSLVNEIYFLYDRSNLIEPTFITEINKLISTYGSISYFDKMSLDEIVKVVSFTKPLKFSVIKDVGKNSREYKVTKNDGTVPWLNDGKIHNFSFTEVDRKSAAMSNPIKMVIDVLNHVQIQINNGRILNTLKKHKNVYYKVAPSGILFAYLIGRQMTQNSGIKWKKNITYLE